MWSIGTSKYLSKYAQPENLLLTSNTPEGLLKLADFGISKIISDEMLTTNCGTPIYMAPEIWSGKSYDSKVDVWSLGVIMYYMLSGTHPFMGDTESIGERIQFDELSFNEGVWTKISCKGN
jgi:serine/threonine protein kinase